MSAMVSLGSDLAYPERFYAAANYAGFGECPEPAANSVASKFKNDTALLLYSLYQQATVGPCNTPKPRAWNPVEQSKWASWSALGSMPSMEAMRLFIKIIEEEDPGWYSRASNIHSDPVQGVQSYHKPEVLATPENDKFVAHTETVPTENENLSETQYKDVVSEGHEVIGVYDQWVAPTISGTRPRARYEHGSAVIDDKMYIFGGTTMVVI